MDYIFGWMVTKYLSPANVPNEAGESMRLRSAEPEPQQSLPFGRWWKMRYSVRSAAD